ncbi:MAG: fibronectin type III domain-containing protein [Bacteroidia bacterium]|nr:fibronectin type III domain-containing protein [Bacteroidia bacterium]MDW8158428.1 fibronectin type III domain-containing protein [Bacteroidia bacterium]
MFNTLGNAIFPLLFFLSISVFSQPRVIINEWSQGPQGNQLCQTIIQGGGEWIELLVVGPGNVNLQGYNVRIGSFKVFEFNNNPLWESVAPGTLIVVYNGNGALAGCKDPNLPEDDVNNRDCNYRLVLSSSNLQLTEAAYRRNWGTNASFTDASITQPNANRDNPTLYDGDNVVHDWDQGDNFIFITTRRPNSTNEAVAYTGNNVNGINGANNWQVIQSANYVQNITPGEPNGGRNSLWIESMRIIIGAPRVQDATICGSGRATITAQMGNPPGNQIELYTQSGGGSPIFTATTAPFLLTTPVVTTNTTFYVGALEAASGCRSARTAVLVSVTTPPGEPRAQTVSACPGQQVKFYAQMGNPPGNEMRMYLSDTARIPLARATTPVPGLGYEFITPPISTTTTFYLESWDAARNCASRRTPVEVKMAAVPGSPKAENLARCESGVFTFTITMGTPAGNRIRIFSMAQGGTPLRILNQAPYLFTTPPLTQTTTYYLESIDTLAGCPSLRTPIIAIIHPRPASPLADTISQCGPGKAELRFYAFGNQENLLLLYDRLLGGNLINRVEGGPEFIVLTPEISTNSVFYGAVVNIQTGCTSSRSAAVVNVLPLPGVPKATATPVCLGETTVFTLAFTNPAGTHIFVYENAEGDIPVRKFSAPPFEFTTHEANFDKFYYFATYDSLTGCFSRRVGVKVPLRPIPLPPAVQDVSRCGAGNVELQARIVDRGDAIRFYTLSNGGFPLVVDSEPPYVVSLSNITTTSTFYFDVLDSETGCFSLRTPATVTIHPLPVLDTPVEVARCGEGDIVLAVTPQEADKINLYTQEGANISIKSFQVIPDEENFLTFPNIARTSIYFLEGEVTATRCRSGRLPVTLIIHPIPAQVGGRNLSRCGAGEVSLKVSPTDFITNRIEVLQEGEVVAFANQEPWELQWRVEKSALLTIRNIDTTTGCASVEDTIRVRVLPLPNVPKADPIIRCGAGKVVFTVIQTSPRGEELQLYTVANGGTPVTTLAMPASDTILFLTPEVTQNTTFYLTALSYVTGCEAPRQMLPVRISAALNVSVQATPATNGVNGIIRVSAQGGVRPYTYSIGGPFVEDSVFASLAPGTYQVWVKDAGACLSRTTVVVENIPERCSTPAIPDIVADALGNVTVTWLPIPGALRYELQYRLEGILQWQNTISTIDNRVILAALENNRYELRLRAVCSSVPSEYVTTTFSSRPICKALNLNILNVRESSAVLFWSAEGSPSVFEVRFKASLGSQWQVFRTSALTLTLENLQPNTQYDVCVRAFCQGVQGEETCSFFRTREGSTCPTPQNPFISEVTTRSAVFSWSQVVGAESYMLRYRIVGSSSWIFENARPPHFFRNLQSGTTYEVQVRALCGSISSAWTNLVTFTTVVTREQALEEDRWQKWVVYPNPTQGIVYLQGIPIGSRVELRDSNGKLVIPSITSQEEITAIDISSLPQAWYFVQVYYGAEALSIKVRKE